MDTVLQTMVNLDKPHLQFRTARISLPFLAQSRQNFTRYTLGLPPSLSPLNGTTETSKGNMNYAWTTTTSLLGNFTKLGTGLGKIQLTNYCVRTIPRA